MTPAGKRDVLVASITIYELTVVLRQRTGPGAAAKDRANVGRSPSHTSSVAGQRHANAATGNTHDYNISALTRD